MPPINPIISALTKDPQVAAELIRVKKKIGSGDLNTLIAQMKRESDDISREIADNRLDVDMLSRQKEVGA